MQKLIFGESVRKNGKLKDQICFVCQAYFILMEKAKNHVQIIAW